jgi:hypothetical protein
MSYLTISTLPIELGFVDIVRYDSFTQIQIENFTVVCEFQWYLSFHLYTKKNGEKFAILIFSNSFKSEGINVWMKISQGVKN